MNSKEVLEQALALRPDERFSVVEGILRSLDEPDTSLDAIWAEEAEKRLRGYREGNLEAIQMREVFKEERKHNKSVSECQKFRAWGESLD